jgi:peptide/nickel transport system ATP-binding protein
MIHLDNVSVEYRLGSERVRALRKVSLDIPAGTFVAIMGPSGSGKTTISRCIMKLVNTFSGSIIYKGVDISNLKGKALLNYRKEVQVIYQDPFESLNPRDDVYTIVSTPMILIDHQKDPHILTEAVSSLLEELALDPREVLHRYPHELSGGERQRINIARALAPNPKVLIADEPVTMLDSAQRVNILSMLMRLKSTRNLTLLIITHDLASAKLTSERTIVLYRGNVCETGPTQSVLTKPHHPYVELIHSSTPEIRPSSDQFSNYVPFSEFDLNTTRGCIFRPRCKYATQVCQEVEPALLEKSKTHYAACHNPLNYA